MTITEHEGDHNDTTCDIITWLHAVANTMNARRILDSTAVATSTVETE